nr:monocarboxylate transporter 13-like [Procambarus clarkii]
MDQDDAESQRKMLDRSGLPVGEEDLAVPLMGKDLEVKVVSPKPPPAACQSTPPSAKDRWYGWVVVAATFVINVIVAGYVKSFGLFYLPIVQQFPNTSVATGGLIVGLLTGCRGLLAPAMGLLMVWLGPRVCSVCGGMLTALGFLLALPATSVLHLAITLGALVGVGLSMSETPGFIMISEYFDERRSTANGFRAAGNPFGGAVFPFIVVFLSRELPLKGIILILSGIMLQICVLGMLLRPFPIHQKIIEQEYFKNIASNSHTNQIKQPSQPISPIEEDNSPKQKKAVQLSVLKNPVYLVYIVMIVCTNAGLANTMFYLILYSASIDLTQTQISFIVGFISILDVFGRMMIGWISDTNCVKRRYIFILGHVVAGLSTLMVPVTRSFWTLLPVVCVHAMGVAAFWALINTLLADQFGEESLHTTWGFFRMVQGITSFAYPSLLGLVSDMSGWMGAPFLLIGSMYLLGGLVFALQPIVIKVSGIKVPLT